MFGEDGSAAASKGSSLTQGAILLAAVGALIPSRLPSYLRIRVIPHIAKHSITRFVVSDEYTRSVCGQTLVVNQDTGQPNRTRRDIG